MTRAQYMAALRDLNDELMAAHRSGDESLRISTMMALEAFLTTIRLPSAEVSPETAR